MKRRPDCIVGLREANNGSGVGLFNQLLASRLGIPYRLLDEYIFTPREHPVLSLKFEELSPEHYPKLTQLAQRAGHYSLFLHTRESSRLEDAAIDNARVIYCGNDAIYRELRWTASSAHVVRAFAPSLIPGEYLESCRPGRVELFCFGMAAKLDRRRFLQLRDLLIDAGVDYQLLGSLAVHQTSNGGCLESAVDFLRNTFGERFIYLGTLSDMGIAYFLNGDRVFVGFYRDAVRSNNTTFNTALRYGNRIISNLDENSPAEVRTSSRILNLDTADARQLCRFLAEDQPDSELCDLFTWDELLARILEPWQTRLERVA